MSIREWTRGAWAGVAGVIAVLAVVVGVALVVGADDEKDAPTSAASGSGQDSPSAPSTSTSTVDRPVPPAEIDYRAEVRRAAEGGLAPFVPDGRRWVVTAATFRDGSWQLVVNDGESEARVVQTDGADPEVLVSRHLANARRGQPVDLGRWQLGEWSSWADPGRHALAREFSHGVVLVTGADAETVRSATESLMTYEQPRGGDEG